MTTFTFTKAVKAQEKLRLALDGPAGAGKTWTSLIVATHLATKDGGRVALIDSERGSARKYASDFDFDHLELPDSNPHTYIGAIRAAVDAGYTAIVIDSLSHAWEGTLALKDEVAKRSRSNDSFGAWREITPIHNELVDTMLRAPAHLIVTMRTKTEYLIERDDSTGKNRIQKLGLKPVQRDGVEYEFDIVGDLDLENTLVVSKTRCSALSGAVIRKPDQQLATVLWDWLNDGEPAADRGRVDALVAAMNALPDEQRKVCKEGFVDRFGRPDQVRASALDDAEAFVDAYSVTSAATSAEPEPATGSDPVADEPAPTQQQMRKLHAELRDIGIEGDARHPWVSDVLGRTVESLSELSRRDVEWLLNEFATGVFNNPGEGPS